MLLVGAEFIESRYRYGIQSVALGCGDAMRGVIGWVGWMLLKREKSKSFDGINFRSKSCGNISGSYLVLLG